MPNESDELRTGADSGGEDPDTQLFAGRFLLLARLGGGHSGTVYRARDQLTGGAEVALKVMATLRLDSPRARARFSCEAELLHEISHPSIVRIYGYGVSEDDIPYISMELLEGETLDNWRASERSAAARENVLRQLAEALAFLHRHKLIHRDLKPSNIWVTVDGSVKVLDFGAAMRAEELRSPDGESTEIAGTPGFMAPEQCTGQAATARSDVFSFGVVAATLFGIRPFTHSFSTGRRAQELAAMQKAVRSTDEIPRHLKGVIARCLERAPNERFPDGGELLKGLEAQVVCSRRVPARYLRLLTGAWAVVSVALISSYKLRLLCFAVAIRLLSPLEPLGLNLLTTAVYVSGIASTVLISDMILHGHYGGVMMLLERNPQIALDGSDESPLKAAIKAGAFHLIPLLARHEGVTLQDAVDNPLNLAIVTKRWDAIPPLLKAGANPASLHSNTVRVLATECRPVEMKLILDGGYDLMRSVYVDQRRVVPSAEIAPRSCPAVLGVILDRYPKTEWPVDDHGMTGLEYAFAVSEPDLVPTLIAHGVDLVRPQPGGRAPLIVLVLNLKDGDDRFVRNVALLSESNRTVLFEYDQLIAHAAQREQLRSLELVLAQGRTDLMREAVIATSVSALARRRAVPPDLGRALWGPEYLSAEEIVRAEPISVAMLDPVARSLRLRPEELFMTVSTSIDARCIKCVQWARRLGIFETLNGSVEELVLVMITARTTEPDYLRTSWLTDQ